MGLMAACVFALSLWVNLAAQVKRCREAFGGLTWFWVNLAQSIVCTMFPLLLLVSVRFSLVYYGVLFSKPANLKSRDGTMPRDPATDATASRTSREHRASGGLAAMSTEELRARAAQLQEPEEPAREVQLFPPPVPSHSAGSVPVPLTHEAGQHQTRRVFGRR